MEKRQHYRNVYKSDHLSSYDLEDYLEQGVLLEFTIKHVTQHQIDPNVKGSGIKVAGKMISANILHFVEPIKPMCSNATNDAVLKKLTGSSFVNDWKNVKIELYIKKNISLGKERVQGIRIKEEAPKGLTEQDIKFLKSNISDLESQAALNTFYSSLTSKEKTNKEINEALKEKQLDLKQTA